MSSDFRVVRWCGADYMTANDRLQFLAETSVDQGTEGISDVGKFPANLANHPDASLWQDYMPANVLQKVIPILQLQLLKEAS